MKVSTKISQYEFLKSRFKEGLDTISMEPREYLEKKIACYNPEADSYVNKVIAKRAGDMSIGLLRLPNNSMITPEKIVELKLKLVIPSKEMMYGSAAKAIYTDIAADEYNHELTETFESGQNNPHICFLAWYDALAEHVSETAERLKTTIAPVQAIQNELNNILSHLSKNIEFNTAKDSVFSTLKDMYPKTYKARVKLCKKSYEKTVQDCVDKIVKEYLKK